MEKFLLRISSNDKFLEEYNESFYVELASVTGLSNETIKYSKIIFEKAYTYYEFEEELFPLNAEGVEDVDYYFHQWAGEILKGKPMVLYGFFGPAFGRDIIEFVSNKEPIIEVLIDNRH